MIDKQQKKDKNPNNIQSIPQNTKNSSTDINNITLIAKTSKKSWIHRTIHFLCSIIILNSLKNLTGNVSAQSITKTTLLDQANVNQLDSKFIIRLRTLQDTLLSCGQPLAPPGSKPCSDIVKTPPSTWTASTFNPITNSVNLKSAVQFGDSSSETVYFLVSDNKQLLRYRLPTQTTQLISYSTSHFFYNIQKSKIPNQEFILVLAFDNPSSPLSHSMHIIDTLSDQSISNFPNIVQSINFIDTGHITSRAIFVDTEDNFNHFVYDFDYTILSSTPRSFEPGQSTANYLAQVRFSIDDIFYFLTGNGGSSVSYLRAYRYSDQVFQSELDLEKRPHYLQTFPYSKYLVVSLRGPPNQTSKLNIVDYRDLATMVFVLTDPDDKFEGQYSTYYNLNLEQVGNQYEIYFTNSDQQLKGFKLVYDSPIDCHGTCLTCREFDGRSTSCLTCRDGFIFKGSNSTCRCEEGKSQLLGPDSPCEVCDTGCKTCSSLISTCTSCMDPYVHVVGSSTCICPPTTHEIDGLGDCVVLGPEPPSDTPTTYTTTSTNTTNNNENIIQKSINLKSKYFSSLTQEITLKFDTKISVKKFTSNPSSYTITTLSNSPTKKSKILKLVKFEISKKTQKIIIFKLNLDSKIFHNQKLTISTSLNFPTSIENPVLKYSKFPIEISNIDFYSTYYDSIINRSSQLATTSLKIATNALLLTSSQNYVSLAKLLQMIDFLHLLNIQVPNNVQNFYDSIKGDFIEFIPNPFYNTAVLECELHRKVENAGFECLLANNNGQFILVFLAFLGFKLLVCITRNICRGITALGKKSSSSLPDIEESLKKQKKTPIRMVISILDSYISRLSSWRTLVNLLISLQIDVLISICIYLQAKYYTGGWFLRDQNGDIEDQLSVALLFFYIVTYLVITGGMLVGFLQFLKISKNSQKKGGLTFSRETRRVMNSSKTRQGPNNTKKSGRLPFKNGDNFTEESSPSRRKFIQNNRNKSSFREPAKLRTNENSHNDKNIESSSAKVQGLFLAFYEDINLSSKIGSLYILIQYFRDILIPFTIISLTWRPQPQLYCVSFYLFFKLIFLLIFRPFSTTWKNILEIASDMIYLSILSLYSILLELGEGITPPEKYYYLGFPIIGLVVSLLMLNIANLFKELFEAILSIRMKDDINKIEVGKRGGERGSQRKIRNLNFQKPREFQQRNGNIIIKNSLNNQRIPGNSTKLNQKKEGSRFKRIDLRKKNRNKKIENEILQKDERLSVKDQKKEKNINRSNIISIKIKKKKKEDVFVRFKKKIQSWSRFTHLNKKGRETTFGGQNLPE